MAASIFLQFILCTKAFFKMDVLVVLLLVIGDKCFFIQSHWALHYLTGISLSPSGHFAPIGSKYSGAHVAAFWMNVGWQCFRIKQIRLGLSWNATATLLHYQREDIDGRNIYNVSGKKSLRFRGQPFHNLPFVYRQTDAIMLATQKTTTDNCRVCWYCDFLANRWAPVRGPWPVYYDQDLYFKTLRIPCLRQRRKTKE